MIRCKDCGEPIHVWAHLGWQHDGGMLRNWPERHPARPDDGDPSGTLDISHERDR